MKKYTTKRYLIFILIIFAVRLFGQNNSNELLWIFLKPGKIEQNQKNKIQYSTKTINRLQKNNWKTNQSDFLPSKTIRKSIENEVVKIRHYSRSLCAYSVEVQKNKLETIRSLPFVKKIQKVGMKNQKRDELYSDIIPGSLTKTTDFYGNSYDQLEQLNVINVHDMGLSGQGIRIAVLDAGFRKDHNVFEYLVSNNHLIDEYDFINNDDNVQNENLTDTINGQHNHGTAVLSCIVGYVPDILIAPAYNAEILLAKTEDDGSETRIEEDNFVAAIEWAENQNADIISSSLGYRDFDNFEYPYSDLDGETAVATMAVNWAFNRGILVVTSAGNDAQHFSDGGIISPGDAKGALTVGAVDKYGTIASFSSHGPTYDGRIKPEICARGSRTYLASASSIDAYRYSNGTSFSTPLITGCCALILEKYPHWTPSMIIDNLKTFSDRSDLPDNRYGWGIPDIYKLITETQDTVLIDIKVSTKQLLITPNPSKNFINIYFKWTNPDFLNSGKYELNIFTITGEIVFSKTLIGKNIGEIESVSWDLKNKIGKKVSSGIYLVEITGEKMHKIGKFTILK